MAFDFKREYKEFYLPKNIPAIVDVPCINYVAVRGAGDPNEKGGAYQQAISVLYAVSYTVKMSYKGDYRIKGFFEWAVAEAEKKKKIDCSPAEFLTVKEGLCVQIMHIGSYDSEPESVALMDNYLIENGYQNDMSESRLHHEIYLSDPRKTVPEKRKTIIRHPIKML